MVTDERELAQNRDEVVAKPKVCHKAGLISKSAEHKPALDTATNSVDAVVLVAQESK